MMKNAQMMKNFLKEMINKKFMNQIHKIKNFMT